MSDGHPNAPAPTSVSLVPLVFVGSMWGELVEWARRFMLRPGFELASPADMTIPQCVETADQAIAIIRARHAVWVAAQPHT